MIKKYVSNLVNSNCYLKINNKQGIIIDAGVGYEKIKQDTNGIKIVGILVTHCHFDHIYYLKQLIENFNCDAYISNSAKNEFNNSDFNMGEMFGTKVELPNKNIKFIDEGKFNLGNFEIEAIKTSGHSIDGMCYKIDSVLFSGDTLFKDAIGRTDFKYSSVNDMINSLKKLKKVKFNVCLSGHGGQSDYYEQQNNINYFIDLLEKYK